MGINGYVSIVGCEGHRWRMGPKPLVQVLLQQLPERADPVALIAEVFQVGLEEGIGNRHAVENPRSEPMIDQNGDAPLCLRGRAFRRSGSWEQPYEEKNENGNEEFFSHVNRNDAAKNRKAVTPQEKEPGPV